MATGCYHIFNAFKFRLAEAYVKNQITVATTKELEALTGIPRARIARMMCHYTKRKYGYFRRLPKKDGYFIRYKITDYGIMFYFKCVKRIKLGFDLNMLKKVPKRMSTYRGLRKIRLDIAQDRVITLGEFSPYIGLTKQGVKEIKLTDGEKFNAVGLFKKDQNPTNSQL